MNIPIFIVHSQGAYAMRTVIEPGNTLCILGGGQLGLMSAQAANQLGYRTMVWAPKGDNPAMEVATYSLERPFDCERTMARVLRKAQVITTEWENIPLALIKELQSRGGVVRPGAGVLEVAQSRIAEKRLAWDLNILTASTLCLPHGETLPTAWREYLPGIVKTNNGGYDGKGQWRVSTENDLRAAVKEANADCVLEKTINLRTELSILVARSVAGEMLLSGVVENTHKNGILDTTVWPLTKIIRFEVQAIEQAAIRIATKLELEGILALEFFVDDHGNVYFNEMAPRPHNSFHGSIEAARTSQFEQHVRAICNLPLGSVKFHTPFRMTNLIGGNWDEWREALLVPDCRLHIYGKRESRPGRKMGHVTQLFPNA